MIYIATVGDQYMIAPFEGSKELRKDHEQILPAQVFYDSKNTLKIVTVLDYEIGQTVSIGGYPIGGKYFDLKELSITDFPVFENAKIIKKSERKTKDDD